jgi:hypothetical protein
VISSVTDAVAPTLSRGSCWQNSGVSGIGVIGAELAGTGLASATLVEASPAYLDVARAEIELRWESRPTRFLLGDFPTIADTLTDADVVTLDRVVCCYPDARRCSTEQPRERADY